MLGAMHCESSDVILDPFSGASTTLIECKLLGMDSYGFEINPFLHWIGNVCLNWDINADEIKKYHSKVLHEFKNIEKPSNLKDLDKFGLTIPPIHNPHRWWRDDVLIDMLHLKECIDRVVKHDDGIKQFFRLCLAGVLVPNLTNVTLGRLQLHFIDKSEVAIDVIKEYSQHFEVMLGDIQSIQSEKAIGNSQLFLQDSTDLSVFSKITKPISSVITSPPYPNRYSYVWNTRPHLYMFDFITKGKEATQIDMKTIGGTWGTATSMLSVGIIEPINEAVAEVVSTVIRDIREQDNLMANYVIKYFNMLTKQILELERLPQRQLKCAYVVGNSRIKDVYIETDVMLGNIFERLNIGYKINTIERIRKRNSGKDLHESIVYAYKN
jgi:hypothetical protein